MAVTLLYGLQKPQTPDKGSVFFPILEDWADWMQDHSHDGSNSSKISSAGVNAATQDLAAASWVATVNGLYRQLVSMPSGITWANHIPRFEGKTGGANAGHIFYLHAEKVSANTFYVYINDNTQDITVIYK